MVFDKIASILAAELGVDVSEITDTTDIVNDLGADSLDMATLVVCIEDEFNVAVSEEAIPDLRLVGDIVAYIEAHI